MALIKIILYFIYVLGGWDGVTVADVGSTFVPEGATGWELGATSTVKGKADEDYEKRTSDPGESKELVALSH